MILVDSTFTWTFVRWTDYSNITEDRDVYAICALCGDVNLDGKVDAADLKMLQRYLFGTINLSEQALIAADVDKDGRVSDSDFAYLKWYLDTGEWEFGLIFAHYVA